MPAVMYSYVFLLLSAWVAITQGLNCNPITGEHSTCACTLDDGSGTIDISPYANSDYTPKFDKSIDGFEYKYNPCYPMNVDGYPGCSDDTAAGCQLAGSGGYNIGKFDQATFSVDPDSNNVIISYSGGDDARNMKVALICNHDKTEPEFTAEGEKVTLEYHFSLESKCSCPYKEGESCTKDNGGGGNHPEEKKKSKHDPGIVGIVLLCVALVAFVSYFVIGAIIMRVRYQKSGSELIVNKEFWKDFPILVKDGVVFTFSPCYKMIKNRQGGYSTFK